MKRNVDLTENQDFLTNAYSQMNTVGNNDLKVSTSSLRQFLNFPIYLEDSGAIRQGDKTERKSKDFTDSFSDKVTCDCCGRRIYPYYDDTLCIYCLNRDIYINFEQEWR